MSKLAERAASAVCASSAVLALALQWQNGKQVNPWPARLADGKLKFPKFMKVGSAN